MNEIDKAVMSKLAERGHIDANSCTIDFRLCDHLKIDISRIGQDISAWIEDMPFSYKEKFFAELNNPIE